MTRAVASAKREKDGIIVTVPPSLQSLVDELASVLPIDRKTLGTVRISPTHTALELLTRVFGDQVQLDESLKHAMLEVRKRQILRRQIVGPTRSPAIRKSFVASPSRHVFHRTNCEWAGEIGTEMLIFGTVREAARKGYRPCRLCRPLDARPPAIPEDLKPYERDADEAVVYDDMPDRTTRRDGRFLGSALSLIYHLPECQWAAELGNSAVGFSTAADAEALGYRPCRVCEPYKPLAD